MKKCVIIPDSFKGTMSSMEICEIIGNKIRQYYPTCEIVSVPVADGGEGTVDCFVQAIHAKKVLVPTTGPYGETIDAWYGATEDTAVIEMAMCAGLPLAEGRLNPAKTTTFGVGTVMKKAIEDGYRKLVLGLGGSCTNDGGAGMAAALGVRFYNAKGAEFVPVGETLKDIFRIDTSAADKLLSDVNITAMCDIDNPLYGKNGAAYIFAPQKGADDEMVCKLDEGLAVYAKVINDALGIDVSQLPGSGAAGGMGAGVAAFFKGGKLQSGIQTVLDLIAFDKMIQGANLIFTGEGRIDGQSLRGKVVIGVASRAKLQNIPVIAIVGDVGDDAEKAYEMGVSSIFSINRVAKSFDQVRHRSKQDLNAQLDSLMRFQKVIELSK